MVQLEWSHWNMIVEWPNHWSSLNRTDSRTTGDNWYYRTRRDGTLQPLKQLLRPYDLSVLCRAHVLDISPGAVEWAEERLVNQWTSSVTGCPACFRWRCSFGYTPWSPAKIPCHTMWLNLRGWWMPRPYNWRTRTFCWQLINFPNSLQ